MLTNKASDIKISINTNIHNKIKKRLLYCLAFFFFFVNSSQISFASSQYSTLGEPTIEIFSPSDYKAHVQNWFVTQDEAGIIYVGNGIGLLSYDANEWRLYQTSEKGPIHAMPKLNDRYYVGGISNIGYFENITNGEPAYTSLTNKLPAELQAFSDVNNTLVINNEVYWATYERLIRQNSDGSFTDWLPDSNFRFSWAIQDQLYISDPPYLKKLVNDSFVTIKGFENLNNPQYSFVTELNGELLIATKYQGIYKLNNGVLQPWLKKSNPLSQLFIYGVKLINNMVVINTIKGGVLFFDLSGELLYQLDKSKGLPVNAVLNMFQDKQLGLWLAQAGFITRVRLPFDVSIFSQKSSETGNINQIFSMNNKIYAASLNGLFAQNEKGVFQPQGGITSETFSLIMLKKHPIGLENTGIYAYDLQQQSKQLLLKTVNPYPLQSLKHQQDSLLTMAAEGLYLIQLNENGQPQAPRLLFSAKNKPLSWAEDNKGHLWWLISNNEIIKIQPEKNWLVERKQVHFTSSSHLFFIDNELLISNENGLFTFNAETLKATDQKQWFTHVFGNNHQGPHFLTEDHQGAIWLEVEKQQGLFSPPDSSGKRTYQQYPIKTTGLNSQRGLIEIDNIHWLTFNNGIARIDKSKMVQPNLPTIAIRGLSYVDHKKPFITAGIKTALKSPVIQYQNQLLRFHYSLTDYNKLLTPEYRYRIDHKEWSQWSGENFSDVASLWNGEYRFDVQAKDFYGNIITAKPLMVNILPAWYLSYWAFLIYIIVFIIIILTIAQLLAKKHTKKLVQDKIRLEAIITKRTSELVIKTEKLEEMDEAKSRFFANVSHEFRTPLTLTMGPLEEILRESSLDKNIRYYTSTALRNAKRMMALLSQILDVNRLEAGHVDMRVAEYDLTDTCRNELRAITVQAKSMKIQLEESGLKEPLLVYFDQDQISKIIMNLLSNALKFTPSGGTIHLSLENKKDHVFISIKDNGKGIAKDIQSQIFERYFQAKDNQNSLQPGTGIGLSLVKELVELHKGNIKVESNVDKGSCFTVMLKKGKEHFNSQDLLEPSWNSNPIISSRATLIDKELSTQDYEYSIANKTNSNTALINQQDNHLKTILVADDNSELREFIRLRLDQSYHVIEAEDGKQALELTRRHLPDLIISDVMMPNMTGLEFASIMKSDPEISHIPLILLTARSTKRDIVEGLQGGANDYLTKPFDTSELSARIFGLLTQQERLRVWIKNNTAFNSKQKIIKTKRQWHEILNDYVLENISDHELSIESISKTLNMGRTSLFRKIKKEFDCTPQQYLHNTRLKYAAKLIKNKQGTVSEIAYAVGFNNYSYFSRSFNKVYKLTPSEFMKTK